MIPFLRILPAASPFHRAGRLQTLGLAVLGFGVLAVWDPVAHPSPRCCLMRLAFGIPCPVCGMTRGVYMCEHGRFAEATAYHPLAIPLCIVALVLCATWTYEFVTKKRVELVLRPAWRRALWAGVYAIVLAGWAWQLLYFRDPGYPGDLAANFAASWVGQLLHQ